MWKTSDCVFLGRARRRQTEKASELEKNRTGARRAQVDVHQASPPPATNVAIGSLEMLHVDIGDNNRAQLDPTRNAHTRTTEEVWAGLVESQRARVFQRLGLDYGSKVDRNYFLLVCEVGLVDLSMETSEELWEEDHEGRLKTFVKRLVNRLQSFNFWSIRSG